jgi:hypothetical protein
MTIFFIRAMPILLIGVLISSATAYACSRSHKVKAFTAATLGYWFVAALLNAAVFSKLDVRHIVVSLLTVAPLIFLPGLSLLFCVFGKLTPRAIIPVAVAAVVVAFPISIYISIVVACGVLGACP